MHVAGDGPRSGLVFDLDHHTVVDKGHKFGVDLLGRLITLEVVPADLRTGVASFPAFQNEVS
jgi:hypothetical protein